MLYDSLPTSGHDIVDLRPILQPDLLDWYAYLSQRRVYEHTSWNLQSVDDLLPYAEPLRADDPAANFRLAICDRRTGKLVGTVGFHSVSPRDQRAELAYDLAPELWGKGIGSNMAGRMTAWAHQHAGIRRVQAVAMVSNQPSIAVLKRCDFAYEGRLRSYRMVRGVRGDFEMYSHCQE